MVKTILSLGSSIGNRKEILSEAIERINLKIGSISKISSFYETEPWGFADDNLFLNMAISLNTEFSPRKILELCHKIENDFGRTRSNNNQYQARTLDIDIIFYGETIYYEHDLQIPHKYAHKRKFVLIPILEIEPEYIHPILKQPIKEIINTCEDETKIFIPK